MIADDALSGSVLQKYFSVKNLSQHKNNFQTSISFGTVQWTALSFLSFLFAESCSAVKTLNHITSHWIESTEDTYQNKLNYDNKLTS